MKKIIFAMLMAAGMMTSLSAVAAGVVITSGEDITGGTTGDCILLSETVKLTLSSNVSGAYLCDEITNSIKVATCHAAGSRKPTGVDCLVLDSGTVPVTYNDASCDGTTGQQYDIADYRAFAATSTGGSVAIVNLGANCTDSSITAISHFN